MRLLLASMVIAKMMANHFCLSTCFATPRSPPQTFAPLRDVQLATTGTFLLELIFCLSQRFPSEVHATVDGRSCIIQPDVNKVQNISFLC